MSKIIIKMSAEELDKFIGGSTEAALELKHGMMNSFAKAYLKPLVNTPCFETAIEEIKADVKKAMEGEIGEWKRKNNWGNVEYYILGDEAKRQIKEQAHLTIGEILRKEIREAVNFEFNRCIEEMEEEVTNKVQIAIKESKYVNLINRIEASLKDTD